MWDRLRKFVALGAIAALVALALALAFAAGGRAASPNVCNVPSGGGPPLSPASCVTEIVAPHFIASGSDAISVTKFTNESNGGANATHVVLEVDFPSPVTPESVNGQLPSDARTAGCTVSSTSVSCPYGNVASGTRKLVVRFSATATMTLTGSASYGEGPGNPSNPPNDFQVNYDTLTVGAEGSDGGCFGGVGGGVDATPRLVSATTTLQSTSAAVGAAADTTLPCTFVDAGVLSKSSSNRQAASNTQISFVEFPFLPAGQLGTVKILFTPLPSGVNINKLALLEDTSYPLPFANSGFFGTFVTVPTCNRDGSIPGVNGTPAPAATDSGAHANDSCIYNRSTLPKGGGEIDMHVLGSPFDGHYQG